jgi:16S rRNA (uracil1498-N3)-methyltransferase
MPRFYCPIPLAAGAEVDLPPAAARHVQVLRHQPGDTLTLFNGHGGQWAATVLRMGRSDVVVRLDAHQPIEREMPCAVHLLAGITANERMDWLVEKATELGATSITPLLAERSVLKLKGERADKKRAHWQAIAAAACEQCGRNRVPDVPPAFGLAAWLQSADAQALPARRYVLSLAAGAQPLLVALAALPRAPGAPLAPVVFLSGPEGGLSPAEEALALAHGFVPVTLGSRTLRAETAPLAALAVVQAWCDE